MSELTIRAARRTDLDQILALSEQTWTEHAERHPYAFPKNGWTVDLKPHFQKAFRDARHMAQAESQNLIVAVRDKKVVGYALLSWTVRDDVPDWPGVSVDDITVAPQARGSGVGRTLLAAVKERADTEGWSNLTAQVWQGNDASRALFQGTGFTDQSAVMRYGPDAPAPAYPPGAHQTGSIFQTIWPWLALSAAIVIIGLIFRWMGQS